MPSEHRDTHKLSGELSCCCGWSAPAELGELGLVQALLLHSAHPRHYAQLDPPSEGPLDELYLRCHGEGAEMRIDVPPYLVGAAALAFHTDHEGHPLEIRYRGHVICSPRVDMSNLKRNP